MSYIIENQRPYNHPFQDKTEDTEDNIVNSKNEISTDDEIPTSEEEKSNLFQLEKKDKIENFNCEKAYNPKIRLKCSVIKEYEDEEGFDDCNQTKICLKSTKDNSYDIGTLSSKLANSNKLFNQPRSNSENSMDELFVIKNKDTGEVFDLRNEYLVTKFATNTSNKLLIKENPWKNWWKKVRDANEALWDAAQNGDINTIKKLLDLKISEYPADVNSKLLDDWTAIHLACNEGHHETVKTLLTFNANIESQTTMQRTPLHIACLSGSLNVVKVLIENNACINCLDKDFYTPLHYASEHGFVDIVEYLLTKKPDYNLKNHAGLTAYDICLNIQTRKIFENYGITHDTILLTFGRTSLDGLILFNSRADHINWMLHALAMSGKNRTKLMTQNILKNIEKQNTHNANLKNNPTNENRLIRKDEKKMERKFFGNLFKDQKEQRIPQISLPIVEIKEKIGPHSFIVHMILGKGAFGEVSLVEKISTKKLFAMKVLKKDNIIKNNLACYAKTERNVFSLMDHPFIVKMHFAFQTDTKLYMILDYCSGGDLAKLISKKRRLTEDVAKIYICEILLALEALHQNEIVFRDLKPDNVVLDDDGHALLTDFGLSKEGVKNNLLNSFCGSIAYMAPEILGKAGHDKSVDWYLLGVLLYELLYGIPPYYANNREELFDNIKRAPLKFNKLIKISDEAKSLITALMKRDRTKRLGARGEADEIKAHPWFNNINWNDVLNKKLTPPKPEKRVINLENPAPIHDKSPTNKPKNYIDNWSFVLPNTANI